MENQFEDTLFRRPAIPMLIQGLAAYALVVITALLINGTGSRARSAFLIACLVLPVLGVGHHELRRSLAVRRKGWLIAAVLTLLCAVLPYGGLLAVVKGYLGAMLLHPTIAATLAFAGQHALLFVPLALAEEFFFRGYLQETVFFTLFGERRRGPLSARNLVTSILFGLAHGLSTLSPSGLLMVFSGLGLGWVVERSEGSIWPAVFLHACSNLALAWFMQLISLNIPWW